MTRKEWDEAVLALRAASKRVSAGASGQREWLSNGRLRVDWAPVERDAVVVSPDFVKAEALPRAGYSIWVSMDRRGYVGSWDSIPADDLARVHEIKAELERWSRNECDWPVSKNPKHPEEVE